jgi:hypothetical protein
VIFKLAEFPCIDKRLAKRGAGVAAAPETRHIINVTFPEEISDAERPA